MKYSTYKRYMNYVYYIYIYIYIYIHTHTHTHTHTQGIHKKCAATVQISHALITILQSVHPHRSGHLTTEYTESLFLLRCHLGHWPRGPAVSMRSDLVVAHEKTWTVAAADGVRCARVR
jgi:hypothetical protein